MANSDDGFLDALAQFAEVETAAAFVDLDGITAAQGDVRLGLAFEVDEIAANAGAAFGILGDTDGLEAAGPNIARDEAAVQGFGFSGEKLGCFGSLDGGDGAGGAVEDAGSVASFLEFKAGEFAIRFEEASEARSLAGKDREGKTVTRNSRSVNPGNSESDCGIIDKEARFEVVGSVENDLEARKQVARILRIEIGDDRLDGGIGIYGA